MSETNFFQLIDNADLLSYKTMPLFFKQFDKQLNISQVILLAHIHHNGALQPSVLAQTLGYTYGAITSMTNKLVTSGYLTRTAAEQDRRTILLNITASGEQLLNEAEALGKEIRNQVYGVLSEEEITQMIHIQNKLLNHVDNME